MTLFRIENSDENRDLGVTFRKRGGFPLRVLVQSRSTMNVGPFDGYTLDQRMSPKLRVTEVYA